MGNMNIKYENVKLAWVNIIAKKVICSKTPEGCCDLQKEKKKRKKNVISLASWFLVDCLLVL